MRLATFILQCRPDTWSNQLFMISPLVVPVSDVMIPGVEPVPDYVFSHFLK